MEAWPAVLVAEMEIRYNGQNLGSGKEGQG